MSGAAHHRTEPGSPVAHLRLCQQGLGRRGVRVAEAGAHQEAVELRLRQLVGAGLLDRVLRRDHHERPADLVGLPVDGDVPLLHHLEEGGLGLRRGAVDLVGQHQAVEDRELGGR